MSDRYWDSNCFMAVFNDEAGRVDQCRSVLMAAERGELRIVTSALTLTEVIKIKGKKPIVADAEDKIRAPLLDTYDRADLGKLNGKVGSPAMTIGEPPLIPFQVELPEVEPAAKRNPRAKRAPALRKPRAPRSGH